MRLEKNMRRTFDGALTAMPPFLRSGDPTDDLTTTNSRNSPDPRSFGIHLVMFRVFPAIEWR